MSRVRIFRRKDTGKLRHGMWVMTGEHRGAFFHGDRDEVQSPRYSVESLTRFCQPGEFIEVEEISPQQAIVETENYPDGQRVLREIFDRHMEQVANG